MRYLSAILAAVLSAGACWALVADRWDVQAVDGVPASHDVMVFRGETWVFEPRLTTNGAAYNVATGAVACLWWSADGFATVGSNTAAIIETGRARATWTPSCDTGATNYQYIIAIRDALGWIQRITGKITMRPSP